MKPKDFIENVLINEIKDITDKHHYLSCALISIGIEYLGKCLNGLPNWDISGRASTDFDSCIVNLLPQYNIANLKDNLRNGFTHFMAPKGLSLTHTNDPDKRGIHLERDPNNSELIVIYVDKLFEDFADACKTIIDRINNNEFPIDDKIYKDFIYIG